MARAYLYADGRGPAPHEIEAGKLLDRWGAPAVFGRALGYGEIQRIHAAEMVVRAYRQSRAAENWAQWYQDNPEVAQVLITAMEAAGLSWESIGESTDNDNDHTGS